MEILLITMKKFEGLDVTYECNIPVSSLHLAAVLIKHGHLPHILDFSSIPFSNGESYDGFLQRVVQEKVDLQSFKLVYLNCFTTMHFPSVRKVAQIIKQFHKKVKICVGGAHASNFPTEIIKNCQEFD